MYLKVQSECRIAVDSAVRLDTRLKITFQFALNTFNLSVTLKVT